MKRFYGVVQPGVVMFALAVWIFACSDDDQQRIKEVYLGGEFDGRAAYWHQDAFTYLSDTRASGEIKKMKAEGSSIYAMGTTDLDGEWKHVYWKDGVPTELTTSSGAIYTYDMTVSQGDVYVAGYRYMDGLYVATIWKNGTPTALNEREYYTAYGIAVSGSDVYAAGVKLSEYKAVLWKNGQASILSTLNGSAAMAKSMFISGSDIYVAGERLEDGVLRVTYWKNGTEIPVESEYTNVESIFVSGDDVYMVGIYYDEERNGHAAMWKNGVRTLLPEGTRATDIAVDGEHVYIAGYLETETNSTACFWKDGVKQNLPAPQDYSRGWCVMLQ